MPDAWGNKAGDETVVPSIESVSRPGPPST